MIDLVRDTILNVFRGQTNDQEAVDFLMRELGVDTGRRRMVSTTLHEGLSSLAAVDAFKDDPEWAYWLYVQDIGEPTSRVNNPEWWSEHFYEKFFYYCEIISELAQSGATA